MKNKNKNKNKKNGDIIRKYLIEYKFILIEQKYITTSYKFLLFQHFSNHNNLPELMIKLKRNIHCFLEYLIYSGGAQSLFTLC